MPVARSNTFSIGNFASAVLVFLLSIVTITATFKDSIDSLNAICTVNACENENQNKASELDSELELEDTNLPHTSFVFQVNHPYPILFQPCDYSTSQSPFESIASPPPEA